MECSQRNSISVRTFLMQLFLEKGSIMFNTK